MGAAVSTLSSAVAIPLASCFGSCLGTCACSVLQLGTIRPEQCKFFFLGLQIWTLIWAFLWTRFVATLTTSSTWTATFFKRYLEFTEMGLDEARYTGTTKAPLTWEDPITQVALANDVPYKVTLATEGFLLFGLLLSVAGSGSEALLRFWVLKFTLPIILPLLTFVVLPALPMWVCVGFGGVFMLLQMTLLYGGGFKLQDWMRDKQVEQQYGTGMIEEGEKWFRAILGSSIFSVLVSLGLSIYLSSTYHNVFAENSALYLNPHLLIWGTFVLSGLLLGVAVTPWCRHGYVLPSALLMPFFSFIVWTALASVPEQQQTENLSKWSRALMLCGVVGMGAALLGAEANPDLLMSPPSEEDEEQQFLMAGNAVEDPFSAGEELSEDEEEERSSGDEGGATSGGGARRGGRGLLRRPKLPPADPFASALFFFIQMCAAFFVHMIATQPSSLPTFYFTTLVLIACLGLYAYSLIRPYVGGGRNDDL